MTDVRRILNAIEGGDAWAIDERLPLVYEELRLPAAQKLTHEKPGQTLQATALVHEASMRLVGSNGRGRDSRGHFFKVAAEAMRRILIDSARRKRSQKRGGGHRREPLNEDCLIARDQNDDLIALDQALQRLEQEDAQLEELVKLRYFAGLSLEHVASIMGLSRRTVERHWALGRAWLYRELDGDANTA